MKNSNPPILRATWKNVLIEPEKRAPEKSGIFHLPPPEFQGVPNVGTVYAVGPDCSGVVSPGERVIFNDKNPKGIRYSGLKLLVVDESNIVAKLPEVSNE